MDMLGRFSGPYEKKVEAMIRYMRALWMEKSVPEEAAESRCTTKEVVQNDDFTPAGTRRRIRGAIHGGKVAWEKLSDLGDKPTIQGSFAYGNTMVMRGGYNKIDNKRHITIAAAIWILDQLSEQGRLDELYPCLPQVPADKYLCPFVAHPDYDMDLIDAVVMLMLYRNRSFSDKLKPWDSTIFTERTPEEKKKPCENRINYERMIGLLNFDAVEKALNNYENDVWRFYRTSFPAIIALQKEEDRLCRELDDIEAGRASMSKVLTNPKLFFQQGEDMRYIPNRAESRLSDPAARLKAQLKEIMNSGYYTELGLTNSREKVAKKFRSIIGDETVQNLTEFAVEDPFESAFALFFLLDVDSDIPWYYYGSLSVAYTLLDQLPFDITRVKLGSVVKTDDLNTILYRHRYGGERYKEQLDCFDEPVERSVIKNLSQIIYAHTYGLIPRVSGEIPEMDAMIEELGLKTDQEKAFLRMLTYLLNTRYLRAESMEAYRLRNTEEPEEEESPEEEGSPEEFARLQRELRETKRENAALRSALHEEGRLRSDKNQQAERSRRDNERLRAELTDLRELVFSLETQTEEPEPIKRKPVAFPFRTRGKVVSFGGHASWLTEMKKLLPDVTFCSPDVTPNTDLLKNADHVWIQTNCISHGSFYRIVHFLESYDTQIHYFRQASSRKCAEDLARTLDVGRHL